MRNLNSRRHDRMSSVWMISSEVLEQKEMFRYQESTRLRRILYNIRIWTWFLNMKLYSILTYFPYSWFLLTVNKLLNYRFHKFICQSLVNFTVNNSICISTKCRTKLTFSTFFDKWIETFRFSHELNHQSRLSIANAAQLYLVDDAQVLQRRFKFHWNRNFLANLTMETCRAKDQTDFKGNWSRFHVISSFTCSLNNAGWAYNHQLQSRLHMEIAFMRFIDLEHGLRCAIVE